MSFDSFMGGPSDSFKDDGFITVQETPAPTTPNPKMKQFGNTEMANFKTDESAMNIVNSAQTKRDFNLGSAPSPVVPGTPKRANKNKLGDIRWKSSETLYVGGAFFVAGLAAKVLFDRYYK